MTETVKTGLRYLRPLIFFVAIPLFIFIALYDPNVHGPIDAFHEGEALAPASETLRGKLPFRDIYLQHGWGVNLLRTELAFKLFGVSIASSRRFSYGTSGYVIPLAWIGVYLLLYSLFKNKLWIVPAFLLLAFADVLINERHLLPFLSLSLLAIGKKNSFLSFFFAGACAATGAFYSLDTGLYAAVIGIAFILLSSIGIRDRSKEFCLRAGISYVAGGAIAALPFVAYLVWHGILDDFLINCHMQLWYQMETWGIPPPSIAGLFGSFESTTARNRAYYMVIKWYYPVLAYACVSLALLPMVALRKLDEGDTALLLITLSGIVFLRSAFGRADEGHLMYAIAPFWVLNICFMEKAVRCIRKRNVQQASRATSWFDRFQRLCFSRLSAGITVLGLGLYFWATCRNGGIVTLKARLSKWKETGLRDHVELAIERSGGIRVPAEQAEEIERTVAFITAHTERDEPIFDFSNQGAYYFFADRTNPTFYVQAAYAIPAGLQMQTVEQLKSSPPSLILLRENEIRRPVEREPIIYEWIESNYREVERIGPNIILLPVSKGENGTGASGSEPS